MNDFDAVVIGAGAVGLACAARLCSERKSVLVLEAADRIGEGISSRNSEVIHAGIYYPTGSLKHQLCVDGRRRLYTRLAARGIDHRKCGKLIVATDAEEVSKLEALAARGKDNGVEGLRLVGARELTRMEPELRCAGGLLSPETGIFDSHGYLLSLQAEIEASGGIVALRTPFEAAAPESGGFVVRTGGAEPIELRSRLLINSAGLAAPRVSAKIEGLAPAGIPRQRLAKGSYFLASGRSPFSRLIYPAPVDGGLGIHATLDLSGALRFGPDVEWLDPQLAETEIDYRVDEARIGSFETAIRRYWPGLPADALKPDYAGCRPKLAGPGEAPADFEIRSGELPGLVCLYGIESPGLTASLAIADRVARAVGA